MLHLHVQMMLYYDSTIPYQWTNEPIPTYHRKIWSTNREQFTWNQLLFTLIVSLSRWCMVYFTSLYASQQLKSLSLWFSFNMQFMKRDVYKPCVYFILRLSTALFILFAYKVHKFQCRFHFRNPPNIQTNAQYILHILLCIDICHSQHFSICERGVQCDKPRGYTVWGAMCTLNGSES